MRERNVNIDYLKFFAAFMVIFVHFFAYTGFYQLNIGDEFAIISFVLKQIAVICVPLFIMVTGYLMNKKEMSSKYWGGFIYPVATYTVISIVCVFFRKFILCEEVDLKQLVIGIFTFTTIKYSWYVNMYIGLYLLIPFLNMIIDKIKNNKKMFLYLIILLSVFTSTPKFSGYWYFGAVLYPINYYFIGAYFSYYGINMKKYSFIFGLSGILFIESLVANSVGLNFHVFIENNSIFNLLKSILFFSFIMSLRMKKNNFVEVISKHTLSIYLISFMIDSLIYKYFNNIFLSYKERFLNSVC